MTIGHCKHLLKIGGNGLNLLLDRAFKIVGVYLVNAVELDLGVVDTGFGDVFPVDSTHIDKRCRYGEALDNCLHVILDTQIERKASSRGLKSRHDTGIVDGFHVVECVDHRYLRFVQVVHRSGIH